MDTSSEATLTIQQLLHSDPSRVPFVTRREMELLISEQVRGATKLFRELSLPTIEEQLKVTGVPELRNVRGARVYTTGSALNEWAKRYQWYVDRDGQWYRARFQSHSFAGSWFDSWSYSSAGEFLGTIISVERLDSANMPLKVLSDVCAALMTPLTKGADNAQKRESDLRSEAASQQEVLDFVNSVKR
jgi:hypothetical protein